MKLLIQPLTVRICHWIMVACIIILLFTGLYMNAPYEPIQLKLRTIRELHSICAAVLIVNFGIQLYYYLFTAKWTEILFLRRDLTSSKSLIRYMLFITDGLPNYGRYNPGQKLLYTIWLLGILSAIITGTALFLPSDAIALQRLLGGLNTVRVMHFGVAVLFASSIPVHIYLVLTENPAKLQAMFTGYINVEPPACSAKASTGAPPAPPEDGRRR